MSGKKLFLKAGWKNISEEQIQQKNIATLFSVMYLLVINPFIANL
jgi:hypothetical protein